MVRFDGPQGMQRSRKRTSLRMRYKSKVRTQRSRVGKPLPTHLPLCPTESGELPSVLIAKATTHPNIFRKRILQIDGNPRVGDWVSLYCRETQDEGATIADETRLKPELLGYGIYNPKSEIAVRVVRWSGDLPNGTFWETQIQRAVSLRHDILNLPEISDCYRVLHAEADGFPGLVVDRYGNVLSAEVFSAAMAPRSREILEILSRTLGTQHWLIQPAPHLLSQEGFEFAAISSSELPSAVTVHEHDVQYVVNFESGHKTGFFCDQRENRRRLADFCKDRSVLDICCYTGGFAMAAGKLGGASSITGVDLDAQPLEIAKRNARLNGVQAKFTQADAFAYMRDMLRGGKQFDVVVLDPPKLIRNRSELDEGTRKHFDLNRLAMQLVKPGGVMLTCSCAGLLQPQDFTRLVRAAARSAFRPSEFNPHPVPRQMQILAHGGAAACHPVSANCPETEYLKGMWLRL